VLQQTITHSVIQSISQSSHAYSQCASMRRRARPCASNRIHALQCAPMCLLVQPFVSGTFCFLKHQNLHSSLQQDATLSQGHRAMRPIYECPENNISAKSADNCARISALQSYHYSAVKLFSKYSIKCDHGT